MPSPTGTRARHPGRNPCFEPDEERDMPWWSTIFCTFAVLVLDVCVYGLLVPLFAIYLGGRIMNFTLLNLNLDVSTPWEIVMVISLVFVILSVALKTPQEAFFWKKFLSGKIEFKKILLIRDMVNAATIPWFAYKLLRVVQKIIRHQINMPRKLNEGVLYVTFTDYFNDDFLENTLNILPSYNENYRNPASVQLTMDEPEFSSNPLNTFLEWLSSLFCESANGYSESEWMFIKLMQMKHSAIHGAELILYVAQLTAAITKLMYFTSLFNYQRAMNIFLAMYQDGEFDKNVECTSEQQDEEEDPDEVAENQEEIVENAKNESSASKPETSPATYHHLVPTFNRPQLSRP